MGFLSKKKENTQENNLPTPPSVTQQSIAPPAAPNSQTSPIGSIAPPTTPNAQTSPIGSLATPPIPGGNLNEIKEAVSGEEDKHTQTEMMPEVPITTPEIENSKISSPEENTTEESENELNLSDEEALFDFSTLNIPEEENNENNNDKEIENKSSDQDSTEEEINYIKNQKLSYNSTHKEETYFLTTEDFKAMLEIIDSVKARVKKSSEGHLRLMDIKSEEEIEYENLKKDFQFIENKLYEVDNIIFEK